MKKVIDIVELLSVPVQDSQGLLGFNVDIPETKSQSDATAVEFRGWVLGKVSPAIAREVMSAEAF